MIRTCFLMLISCLCFTACKLQEKKATLNKVRANQKAYFNSEIKYKSDYLNISNLTAPVNKKLRRKANSMLKNSDFIILEGINYSSGRSQGIIWNDKKAYLYRRWFIKKWLKITWMTRIKFNHKFEKKTDFGLHIIDKLSEWDTKYINSLDSIVGVHAIHGYNFIASKVSNEEGNLKVETVAFREFVDF